MDINFKHDHKCFNFRVASVIKKEDKILLTKDLNYHTLPGGRVHFGETTETAVKRAVYDALNIHVEISKLLSINENFFDYGEDDYHELLFVYLCEIEDDVDIEDIDFSKFTKTQYQLISCKEILNLNFKPEFILSDLEKVSNQITHNVNK
ncbi:NUDIX domain-containing protein [Mycoplasmatota bacterium]|nr:NUDIX domain-containing protein [Mycoplasmatota bacterium]